MSSAWSVRDAAFLEEMGVGPLWMRRDAAPATAVSEADVCLDANVVVDHPATSVNIADMNWSQLESAVASGACCERRHTRGKTVLGAGDQKAKWLFVGETPSREEDAQGEPFVGSAGILLTNMLGAMGLTRDQNTYITHIVKCRATDENGDDRTPTLEEAALCLPYLERQIELIQPTVIVALGNIAALAMLKLSSETTVSSLRGKVHHYAGRPLIVTYHPAHLLRSPSDKSNAWIDLCLAMSTYAGAQA